MISIYNDTVYSTSATPFDYEIELSGGTTIFRGRAYAAPNEALTKVNISNIARDYLEISIPDLVAADVATTTTVHPLACRTFILNNGNGSPLATYTFLLDWSYEPKDFSSTVVLSNPVDGKLAANMFAFRTTVTSGGVVSTVCGHSGVTGYSLVDDCYDYAVYYLNRSGGFDAYLVRGQVRKTDRYTRYDINRHYTTGSLDFGKKTYNNQIERSYVMNSGWLNDAQADNLVFNLLSSNQVYVHNLRTDDIYPACITDSEAEYRTFENNGRKMVNIRFSVLLSHTYTNIS